MPGPAVATLPLIATPSSRSSIDGNYRALGSSFSESIPRPPLKSSQSARGKSRLSPRAIDLDDSSPRQVHFVKPEPHYMAPLHSPRSQRSMPSFVATPRPPMPQSLLAEYKLASVARPGHASRSVTPRAAATHCANLLEASNAVVGTVVKKDVHRFESRLGRLQLPSDPTNNSRRQQALLQRLFSLRLSENCFVKKELLRRGIDEIVDELGKVCSKFGMRLLTLDDFHIALKEALPPHNGDALTVAESRLLFSLFDEDRSGIVDLDEFSEGLQLLLQDESIVLIAHCRALVTNTHPPVDAMVSALEVDLMFHAAAGFYKGDPALTNAMQLVKSKLWRRAHKGQINVIDFQQAVRDLPTLNAALCALPENGMESETTTSRPPSPDPDEAVTQLASLARRKKDGDDGDDVAPESVLSPSSAHHGRGIAYDATSRQLRFKGDEFKIADESRQLAAPENGNPVWYSSRGQIWRVVEGQAPEPILDE